jgi:hypothetical protein
MIGLGRIAFRCWMLGLPLVVGCQSNSGPPPPAYSGLNSAAARDILAKRAEAIHTFSARCTLTLIRPRDQSIRLDGVMVMAPPDRLRLRAWKLDQPVFDLTLRPDGLWIAASPDTLPATMNTAGLSRQLAQFAGGFFTLPGAQAAGAPSGELAFERDAGNGASIVCDVDARTATVRRFRLIDPSGAVRFSLSMTGYRDIGGVIWPTRLTAKSAGGEIDVLFSEIQFNSELAAKAFVPPAGAQRQP